ncbi:chemosensory receptor A [Elysia marginata]|uniref:Chemosensory receptor A n=1 Tax=Elysia marginata TaxID=1093978 RepID=A0AAV4GH05_9GAST|nr:chemosensory receptor A [Elysia marginata]
MEMGDDVTSPGRPSLYVTAELTINHTTEGLPTTKPLMSASVYTILVASQSATFLIAAIIGTVSNILVILTYKKLGFSDSINISYVALAVSDMGAVITRAWGAMCIVFVLLNAQLPFNPDDVAITTAFWYGQGFEKTTGCITAYISLERCFCVMFPLRVRTIVTRTKTLTIIASFFVLVFGVSTLSHVAHQYTWNFIPARNRTILGLESVKTPLYYTMRQVLFVYFGPLLYVPTLLTVWLCTIILAVYLKRSRQKFKGQINQARDKETHAAKVVIAIASAFLVFTTPSVVLNLALIFVPGFDTRSVYARTALVLYGCIGLLSVFNSGTNLFIYIYTGSKFRETLRKILSA